MNQMNQALKKQIIDYNQTMLKKNRFSHIKWSITYVVVKNKKAFHYRWKKYQFKNLKTYNKECASNLGIGSGRKNLLSKNDLITWCELNNIKCKKSLKYCEIVKLLLNM
tara:strand:- start:2332 stop:2658 length:327 start_codon:yes stop_codon:yes gene_type:complete